MKKLILFLLACSLALPLWADDSPKLRVYPPQGAMIFKGLDTTSSPTMVEDGRASDLLNIRFVSTGGLKKRNGYSLINEDLDTNSSDVSFPAVTGIYNYKAAGTADKTLAIAGPYMYYDNSGTWTDITGPVTITAGKDNQFVWTTALDYAVATNFEDLPIKYDGTDTSNIDFSDLSAAYQPTSAKCVAWFRNRLIWGNTVENSVERVTRVRWSNLGTIET